MARPWADTLAAAKRAFTPNNARNRYLLSRKRDPRELIPWPKPFSISGLRSRPKLARRLQKASGFATLVREGLSSR